VTAATATTAGLLWVLVVLALIVLSCFGVGATIVYMMKKATPQDPIDVLKAKNGNVELSVGNESKVNMSEVDMNPQYHPKNDDFADIDIFANKKRAM